MLSSSVAWEVIFPLPEMEGQMQQSVNVLVKITLTRACVAVLWFPWVDTDAAVMTAVYTGKGGVSCC